jgi:cell division septation protein DedD
MTRTDVMASSRPRTVGAGRIRRGAPGVMRRLAVLPVLLALALALPGAALATESSSSGYKQTPNVPTSGTSPSKESSKPTSSTAPKSEVAPAKSSATPEAKASTLPFTGFDLRWSIAIGLLLIGAGASIMTMQRRQRHGSRR